MPSFFQWDRDQVPLSADPQSAIHESLDWAWVPEAQADLAVSMGAAASASAEAAPLARMD